MPRKPEVRQHRRTGVVEPASGSDGRVEIDTGLGLPKLVISDGKGGAEAGEGGDEPMSELIYTGQR